MGSSPSTIFGRGSSPFSNNPGSSARSSFSRYSLPSSNFCGYTISANGDSEFSVVLPLYSLPNGGLHFINLVKTKDFTFPSPCDGNVCSRKHAAEEGRRLSVLECQKSHEKFLPHQLLRPANERQQIHDSNDIKGSQILKYIQGNFLNRKNSSSVFSTCKLDHSFLSLSDFVLTNSPPLGFSFSPAGLLLSYHLGVLSYLQEIGIVTDKVPLSGASAGALASLIVGCGINMSACLQILESICDITREEGTAGRLYEFLSNALHEMLPDDAHEKINRRPGKITVAVTQVFPLQGHFISNFESKEDVIECVLASCNIPFYFSTWPLLRCRGKHCVDGYFAVPRKEFGCPPTNSARNVKVTPFSAELLRILGEAGSCISPDLQRMDDIILSYLEVVWVDQYFSHSVDSEQQVNEGVAASLRSSSDDSCADVASHTTMYSNSWIPKSTVQNLFHLVNHAHGCLPPLSVLSLLGIIPPRHFIYYFTDSQNLVVPHFTWGELFRIALGASESGATRELFDLGRTDAFRWLVLEYMRLDITLRKKWKEIYAIMSKHFKGYSSSEFENSRADLADVTHAEGIIDEKVHLRDSQKEAFYTNFIHELVKENLINSEFLHILSYHHRRLVAMSAASCTRF
ncbi:phospholipase, patatin family protein [Cardiosporidium cionae]|uniref:Phospholipase, patatin family protein n=1 Tax=Cardiosporidium cionae TaxID=476202 RepID=A0ABQ7J4W5_9APIC|nr:phospholipase, patatin family protein [Cardiosporidium cionae]|eukprot:KAF8818370.1 phospholipase, patatin family protein [Cardiosporidium cionae]